MRLLFDQNLSPRLVPSLEQVSSMNTLTRIAFAAVLAALAGRACAADLVKSLEILRAVGPQGAGNEAATAAWQEVARSDAAELPKLLSALDGANPLAANWIRTAIDAICERTLREGRSLPQTSLEQFVLETAHAPKGRRLAYEWLLQVDAKAEERIVPQLLHDPSLELRRDAVARLIAQAESAGKPAETADLLKKALDAARDRDQVDTIAKSLKKLDIQADLVRHDGLVVDWWVIGPFDNTGGKGFSTEYAPEKGFDPQAEHQGKHGPVRWRRFSSDSPNGQVDLNKALADGMEKEKEREIVGYAAAEFHSPEARFVHIRTASDNALKIWVNGKLVDKHEIYHGGTVFDQYRAAAILQPGRNVILVKACQNAQTQDWAEVLSFQFRVCDEIGTAILSQKKPGG